MNYFSYFLSIALIVMPFSVHSQTPKIEWQKCLGGSEGEYTSSMDITSDGGYLLCNLTFSNDGNVTGNHGGGDEWIVKLNNSGNVEWQKCIGGSQQEVPHKIVKTLDGGFIVAGETVSTDGDVSGNHGGGGDSWVVKLNNLGNIEWQKCLGGSDYDAASSIQELSNGEYIVAGYSQSNDGDVSGNHGGADAWIVKLDNSGNIEWQKSFGGSAYDNALDIDQTGDGGFIFCGLTYSNDGDVSGNHGGYDFWVVKLNLNGNLQWQKCFGGNSDDLPFSIQETIDGSYIVAGQARSNDGDVSGNHGIVDWWVIKLNTTGDLEWQRCLGGTDDEYCNSIQQTFDGGFILSGVTFSNDGDVSGNHGIDDAWIVRINSSGNFIWQECLGGSNVDVGFSVKQIQNNRFIALCGTYSVDGDVIANHGGGDEWIVKLNGTSWTTVTTLSPHPNGGGMLLLSDGTVIAKSFSGLFGGIGKIYDKLISDEVRGYGDGSWSQIKAMHKTRLYYSSQVLMDGRVYVAGGEYGTGKSKAEVYDPRNNTWVETANDPSSTVKDASSEILPDGRILQALVEDGTDQNTNIFDPSNNSFSAGPITYGYHNESSWVKLQDSSILFIDLDTKNSERYIPASNSWIPDSSLPNSLYDAYDHEIGAGLLLPNGRTFFMGGTGHTAYYIPTGTTSKGSWVDGPDIPSGRATLDAPAAMMVDGKILCAVSPLATYPFDFPLTTFFYEFDYLTNSFHAIDAPDGNPYLNVGCYQITMLDLPDGTVLCGIQNSKQYYIYSPTGLPLLEGKPTILTLNQNGCDLSYTLTGTLFNGISEGAAYGDDWQMATNYPIIQLRQDDNVYYARTYNWNSTGVMRGNALDTTQFSLPSSVPLQPYSLSVIANGIASDPISFTPFGASIFPDGNLDICQNGEVLLIANEGGGFTYQWMKGSNLIVGETNQTYVAAKKGTYKVIVSNANCSSTSSRIKVTKSCKEDELLLSKFNGNYIIYPNPSNGEFTIDFQGSEMENSMIKIDVINILGKIVYSNALQLSDGILHYTINLDVSSGVYFVKVTTPDGIYTKQIIKTSADF